MGEPIRVLHVGDDGATEAAAALEREGDRLDVVAETGAADALDRLHDGRARDCVVSRYRLPDDDGLALLGAVREEYARLPFVLFADVCERAVVAEAMARDATDVLPVADSIDQYAVLADRVETAVEHYRADERDDRFSELAETTDEALYMFTADWDELRFVNSAYADIWGRSIDDLRADPRDFLEGVHPDDGSGIPPDKREQVFESGYSTSSDGTGFGLLIVRRIAEAHDWAVDVTESEAGGARFEVTGVDVDA